MKSRKHALRTVTMIGVLIAAHAVAKEPPEDADWYEEYREMQDRAADGGQAFTPDVDVLEQSQASGRGARAEGGDTFSAEHASIDELQREIDRQATIARYYETLDSRMAWQEYVENYGTGAELEDLYFLEAFSRGDHRYGRFFHDGAYYEVAVGDSIAGVFRVDQVGIGGARITHANGSATIGMTAAQDLEQLVRDGTTGGDGGFGGVSGQ